MPMRDKLIDLFKTSALIQGAMALAGFGVICYLAVVGRPIPEILAALVGTFGRGRFPNRPYTMVRSGSRSRCRHRLRCLRRRLCSGSLSK